MTTKSELSMTEAKRKEKLSKLLEQKRKQRKGDHMDSYQWGG